MRFYKKENRVISSTCKYDNQAGQFTKEYQFNQTTPTRRIDNDSKSSQGFNSHILKNHSAFKNESHTTPTRRADIPLSNSNPYYA